ERGDVGRAGATGLNARPRNREAVPVHSQSGDELDVIGGASVAVARGLGCARVDDGAWLIDEVVPDGAATPVGSARTLDLKGRCGRRPAQGRQSDSGLWGGHGS